MDYQILDTLAEQEFDDLTVLASQICQVPIALITLVDEERQWFKSKVGLQAEETPRDFAFCAHAILDTIPLIVPDASNDNRFSDNPLVTSSPNIRFYAGAPLTTDSGLNIGTLCVIDTVPRKLSEVQISSLNALARQVMAQMELRKNNLQLQSKLIEMKELKENFSNLIDHMNEIVFEIDTNGRWIFLNSAWSDITGFSHSESINHRISEFIHPLDRLSSLEKFRPLLEGKKDTCRHEMRFLCKTGETRWFEACARVRTDKSTNKQKIIGTLLDITKHKEFEGELITAREEAIISNQTKTAFLANMSHEIRTPMNGIIAMTSLLIDSKLNGEQFEYAKTIKHSADALLELINDILDFSKIDAGKLDLENMPFDLSNLLTQTIDVLKHSATKNHTRLILNYDKDIPEVVSGDPHRLRQIFTNIIGNAIKFTSNGHVEVRAKLLSRSANHYDVEFAITDTGIGISKEALKNIFDSFSQADNSMTRKYGGTGLGLSITERLVRLMKGKISVQSDLGQGSTFTVQVHLGNPTEEIKQKFLSEKRTELKVEAKNKKVTKSGRLLIAEDNMINQKVFLGLLQGTNYQIDIVDNGIKALEAVKNNKYDLILMDCQMPEMDGYEATLQLKKQTPPFTTPIIAVTANAMKNEKDRCFDVGMSDYISKPISGPRLIETIEKWLPNPKNAENTQFNLLPENDNAIDIAVIEQLKKMGEESGSDLLGDILKIYFEGAPKTIELLKQHFANRHFDLLAKDAHHFRSSCNGVGAISMAEYCEKLEIVCKTNIDTNEIERLLSLIYKDYEIVKVQLIKLNNTQARAS